MFDPTNHTTFSSLGQTRTGFKNAQTKPNPMTNNMWAKHVPVCNWPNRHSSSGQRRTGLLPPNVQSQCNGLLAPGHGTLYEFVRCPLVRRSISLGGINTSSSLTQPPFSISSFPQWYVRGKQELVPKTSRRNPIR